MSHYRFFSYHALTRQPLGPPMKFSSVKWTETTNGNGTMSATLPFPQDPTRRSTIKTETEPDAAAIYCYSKNGTYDWGGVVTARKWNHKKRQVEIVVTEWRAWLFNVYLPPKSDLTGDNSYSWTAQDQLKIAREIIGYAKAEPGSPTIEVDTDQVSGKLRDLNVVGLNFKKAGELLDTISQRDGGFEWTLQVEPHPIDGYPRLRLKTYYPERGGNTGILLRRTPEGGNILDYGDLEETSYNRWTRVWATGEGQPPETPFSQDSDPLLSSGYVLRRESMTNWSRVTDRTTLASHARSQRRFYGQKHTGLSVSVLFEKLDPTTYMVGDRVRLVLKDDMFDFDLPSVRIVSREVVPDRQVNMLLMLSDAEPPEVDTGGVV